ncbi:adenylyltransferase/cytidyltransferase family protein [Halomonas sp. MCCC 1A17488]|uniref:Adenylyltransferase/cytidyltransferase family protein n=1 Tax=Billgrantia sulfidoxydans TaxID=2733484 RepID=A0ABX7VYT2_9GAMM|nr:adenylyltransferase/cytidyltransferase family protein [Halomonas sp. MCCC 1A17488]MCG3240404.1 adenylyltransferase/cytidyltransferase family protein [Halomonas sp. MCCC 1A17488]QPP49732.1 adenylyltransferase/cytidyltransferase family protein [Halomonas sp. SS10-MC5]QTP53343.1 adenylyltransferase/cytidyltransferase family protein [Halomonas sulfidoxydans]
MGGTVITYGTFDMFHIGHLNLLRRLAGMGSRLIVAVSTDEFNAGKGKRTLIPFEQRAEIVRSIRYVDEVIPETNWDQKIDDVQRYGVSTFAIGEDWRGHFDFLARYCEVVYLPRTEGVSTTDLKRSLNRFCSVSREDLLHAFDVLEALRKDFG